MYVGSVKEKSSHKRTSKNGIEHVYFRTKKVNEFICDSCGERFFRNHANMSPKRISNSYFHVCSRCDSKRFAQKKGVEKRKIWDMPASSDMPIGRL